MARVLLDQGLPDQALAASREALSLTPGSVARLVKHGLLAFFYGEHGEACEALARAARFGLNSVLWIRKGSASTGRRCAGNGWSGSQS